MKLHDESWLNYQKGKGKEAFQAYMMDLTDIQEHVLPYLQTFCSLEERDSEKVLKTQNKDGFRTRNTFSMKEKIKSAQPQEKSIHERLARNKKIIAEKMGKGKKEKGIEMIKS